MREITPPTYFLSSLTDWTRKDVRSRNLNDEMKDEMQDADKARRSYLLNNLAESHVPSFLDKINHKSTESMPRRDLDA
jgi:hypothetical protein